MAFKEVAEAVARYGVVPTLLVAGVLVAGISAGQVWPGARSAAYGGFWSGVLASFAVVLALIEVSFPDVGGEPGWVLAVIAAVGIAIGTMITFAYLFNRHRKVVAFPLVSQTLGALGLLYLYVVWESAWLCIAWLALGVAGASSLFYALGRDIWPRRRSAPDSDAAPEMSAPRSGECRRVLRLLTVSATAFLLLLLPLPGQFRVGLPGVVIVLLLLAEIGATMVHGRRPEAEDAAAAESPA